MATSIAAVALACALGSTGGGWLANLIRPQHSWVLPPGPGYGWGFPNGNPDGYGWFDHGVLLPLGADRTGEYYFPRYYAVPAEQLILQSYYNPYLSRGQRYIPYAGGGGWHPMGGLPPAPADLPANPYLNSLGSGPTVRVPAFSGRVEAPPVNAGSTGLTP
jgi:hypothetical protein